MKTNLYIPLLFFSLNLLGQTQKGITGKVIDPSGVSIPGASVILMYQKDSTLLGFTSANAVGIFEMKKPGKGKYILQISSLGFETYFQNIDWESETLKDLGEIQLKNKVKQLKEVDITADNIPVKIKNDTIEYNAKAFKTQPNAVVEDLLKKLPGVEVDKDGTIKAQGKQVNKVLVDGKEFFGDDPKMATKNLPADAIKNVQVFDKKSDAAEFTGIDDGERDKTINLKLKDDKKQGLFGKIMGGYGTSDRYETRANINNFKKQTQMSIVGMSNNTNTQGFTINDYVNFMGGIKNMMSGSGESGRVTLNSSDIGLPLGNGNSKDGFTNTNAGGINYNRELNKKTELRSSYFLNSINKEVDNEIFRQNNLNSTTYNTNEQNSKNYINQSHKLNFIIKHKFDSTQQLIWKANVGRLTEQNHLHIGSQSYNSNGFQQNGENTFNQGDNIANRLNTSLGYLKKLNKKGRNLAATLTLGGAAGDNKTLVNSTRSFYKDGIALFDSSLTQRQNFINNQISYSGKLNYTEPIGKRKYLELNYLHQVNDNKTTKNYFDLNPPSTEVLNTRLSNSFQDIYQFDKIGSNLKFTPNKQTIIIGASYQKASLETKLNNNILSKKYYNILPNASWLYELGTGKQIQTFYQTSINPPSGDQLQPTINNTNPLNLYRGNPNLKPEYKHDFNLSYSSFDQFSFISFFTAFEAIYVKDKITYERSIDDNLVQLNTPVNVKHDITTNGYIMFSAPLRFMKAKLNSSLSSSYNRAILYSNNIQNNVDRYVNTIDIGLENFRKEVIDAEIGIKLTHNLSHYTISTEQNQNFLNRVYYFDFTAYPGKNWTLNTELDYNVYQGNVFGGSQNVPILKASISKSFLKNNRGELKLSAIDLLNRNISINRSSNLNYIQDEHVHTLGRYLILTFTYSLSKFSSQKSPFNIKMKEH